MRELFLNCRVEGTSTTFDVLLRSVPRVGEELWVKDDDKYLVTRVAHLANAFTNVVLYLKKLP